MAVNGEGKVAVGDPLRINANTWNDILDMLRTYKRNRMSISGMSESALIQSKLTVLIKNGAGGLLPVFSIVRLSDSVIDVPDDRLAVNRRPAFHGLVPISGNDSIAISQGPVPDNEYVAAVFQGVTVCRVLMEDLEHEWANPLADTVTHLISSACGQVRILQIWEDVGSGATEGVYLALVQLTGKVDCDDISGGSGGGAGDEIEIDVVTKVCPIFEDVTYEQAIFELFTLLSRIEGYADGRVLGVEEDELEWLEAGDPYDSEGEPLSVLGVPTASPAPREDIAANPLGGAAAFCFSNAGGLLQWVHTGVVAETQFLASNGTVPFWRSLSDLLDELGGPYQPLDDDLDAISLLSGTGILARTGAGTYATRTITGTTSEIDVANGNGVSGNPTISLPNIVTAGTGFKVTFDAKGRVTAGVALVSVDIAGIVVPASLQATGWAYVHAYNGTSHAVANGSWTTIQFDTEVTDTDGVFNPATYTYTPATTGVYLVDVGVSLPGNTGRALAAVWIGTATLHQMLSDGVDTVAGSLRLVALTGGTGYTIRMLGLNNGISTGGTIDSAFIKFRRVS